MSEEELYLPDTPEGRAVEQVVRALGGDRWAGQLTMIRRLGRIAQGAMMRVVGPEETSAYFASLSRDALRDRGCGKGAKRA